MYFTVIMPGEKHDLHHVAKKAIITEAAAESGLLVVRFPPSFPYQTFDLGAALNQLTSAEFVLADLTGERPSCYYELGLAEAMGKKVSLLARVGTPIHQTAARSSVVFFNDMQDFGTTVRDLVLRNERQEVGAGARRSKSRTVAK